ncbi:MAG: DCC1-like thiol-disulfide oxidoreductase family protein [Bacteroidales bacterium]|nr:DCC1-like thiol-disulfide oxidoreductase family protein [Bacteroidales bacterium]MCF8333870.1 DCC1-like thiol-disulfide oxidoreductase family protein [Bacteroidales bacterium]
MVNYQKIPQKLIIYDGHCVICNGSVHIIARYDRSGLIRFTHSETSLGQAFSSELPPGISADMSVIFVDNGHIYTLSDAVIQIAKYLRFPYNLLRLLKILPKKIRDGIYRLIAANRYRIFKRREQCMLPDARLKTRIIQ